MDIVCRRNRAHLLYLPLPRLHQEKARASNQGASQYRDHINHKHFVLPPVAISLAVLWMPQRSIRLYKCRKVYLELRLSYPHTLVSYSTPCDAHHLGRRLVCALARPLFLAVYDERQIGAENLHAAKKLF